MFSNRIDPRTAFFLQEKESLVSLLYANSFIDGEVVRIANAVIKGQGETEELVGELVFRLVEDACKGAADRCPEKCYKSPEEKIDFLKRVSWQFHMVIGSNAKEHFINVVKIKIKEIEKAILL